MGKWWRQVSYQLATNQEDAVIGDERPGAEAS